MPSTTSFVTPQNTKLIQVSYDNTANNFITGGYKQIGGSRFSTRDLLVLSRLRKPPVHHLGPPEGNT